VKLTNNNLGKLLREYADGGGSLTKLSKACGVNHSTLYELSKGEYGHPKINIAQKILRCFGKQAVIVDEIPKEHEAA